MIKLQGIYGMQKSKKVADLKIGDVIRWNYDYRSEVVDLIPSKSGKTVTAMLKSLQTGTVSGRKMGATREVAVI